jgi:hypothetical protein
LQRLHLNYIQSHYQALATKAAEQQRSHLDYLEQLVASAQPDRPNTTSPIKPPLTSQTL